MSSASADTGTYEDREEKAVSDAKNTALAYYEKKYNDPHVSVHINPFGAHMEANITKNGFLVAKLFIQGNKVIEKRTGVHDWVFDQFILAN